MQDLKVLKIIISSPGDVPNERKAAKEVIEQLDKLFTTIRNYSIKSIMWEKDVYPGIGEYVQGVINKQIEGEYDMYLGLMWKRFGTPTKDFKSGTAEEFDNALNKFAKDNQAVKILFYFKNDEFAPLDLDPDQIKLIQDFRSKMALHGALTKTFTKTKDFRSLLFDDLTKAINDLITESESNQGSKRPQKLDKVIAKESTISKDDELNKLIEIYNQELSKLSENTKEDDYKALSNIKRLISNKIESELANKRLVLPNLKDFFEIEILERIYNEDKLTKATISDIVTARLNKDGLSWVFRHLIVSALSLSLIKSTHFDPQKAEILLDFISEFDQHGVWERALTGLILGLLRNINKWQKYGHLKTRLESLRDLERVQNGLDVIELILRNKLYDKVIFYEGLFTAEFFSKNPLNCFLPFYSENPLIQECLDTMDNQSDYKNFDEYINNLPFLNAYKYALCLGLKNKTTKPVLLKKNEFELFKNTINITYKLNPWQNLIGEFYVFFKYYPATIIKDFFEPGMSLMNAPIRDVILNYTSKHIFLARLSYSERNFKAALQSANNVLKIDDQNFVALWIKAECYAENWDFIKAREIRMKIKELRPDDLDNYLVLANTCYFANLEKEAIEYYEKINFEAPQYIDALLGLASSYLDLGDREKCVEFCVKIKTTNKGTIVNLKGLAALYYSLGLRKEAIDLLEYLLKQDEQDVEILVRLCFNYIYFGDKESALKYALKAIAINKDNAAANNMLGLVYLLGYEDFEQSRKYIEYANKIGPDASVLGNLALLELVSGNKEKALDFYKKSVIKFSKLSDFKRLVEEDIKFITSRGISKKDCDVIISEAVIFFEKNKNKRKNLL